LGRRRQENGMGLKIYADERLDVGSIATMVESFTNKRNNGIIF
jgi:hypothetical protein